MLQIFNPKYKISYTFGFQRTWPQQNLRARLGLQIEVSGHIICVEMGQNDVLELGLSGG